MAVKHVAMAMEPGWSSGMEVLQVLPVVILRLCVLQKDLSIWVLVRNVSISVSISGSLGMTRYL